MFERLQKPFLTVETGEAYQPIRLTYEVAQPDNITAAVNSLKCCEATTNANTWNWYWRDECADLRFESIDNFTRSSQTPIRLGTLILRDGKLYLSLPSFKRACLATSFFHRVIQPTIAKVHHADFINKVFGIDEKLPHGFTELFNESELEAIVKQRVSDFEKVQMKCENAESAEEAISILNEYNQLEAQKRLPYAERYLFQYKEQSDDPDVIFLSFYIFLRSRELVAIHRWFGDTGYSLTDAVDEAMEQVFGGMNIDILE